MNMPAMQYVMYATIVSILWFGSGLIFPEECRWESSTATGYVLQVLNSDDDFQCVYDGDPFHGLGKRILEVLDEEIEIKG